MATATQDHVTFADLERQAIEAHASGESWNVLWGRVAGDVRQLVGEPKRVYTRLLSLWA